MKKTAAKEFNSKSSLQKRWLYHCMPATPQGDHINVSLGYGSSISTDVREKLSVASTEKVPLVFATPYMSKSLAFGFSYHDKEILLNASISDDVEYVVIVDRDSAMRKERDITVFRFQDTGFVDLPNARQCVSAHNVSFRDTEVALKAKNVEDLMHAGLQVLSLKKSMDEVGGFEFFEKDMRKNGGTLSQCLGRMIKQGVLVWENQALGVNPHAAIKKEFGLAVKSVEQSINKP